MWLTVDTVFCLRVELGRQPTQLHLSHPCGLSFSQCGSWVLRHPRNECSKRFRQTLSGFCWPSLGSPRTSFLPHSISSAITNVGLDSRFHLLQWGAVCWRRPSQRLSVTPVNNSLGSAGKSPWWVLILLSSFLKLLWVGASLCFILSRSDLPSHKWVKLKAFLCQALLIQRLHIHSLKTSFLFQKYSPVSLYFNYSMHSNYGSLFFFFSYLCSCHLFLSHHLISFSLAQIVWYRRKKKQF